MIEFMRYIGSIFAAIIAEGMTIMGMAFIAFEMFRYSGAMIPIPLWYIIPIVVGSVTYMYTYHEVLEPLED